MITCGWAQNSWKFDPSDQRRAWVARLWWGGGRFKKKEGAHDRGAAAVSVCKTYTFSYKISYNPAWQKEAVNRGQNWLFNRSNRLLSGRL